MNKVFFHYCRLVGTGIVLLVWGGNPLRLHANPTGGVVAQGTATIGTSGSQLTINQTSASAFINWQSFNISAGEATVFNQPSSSSVTWNYINDPNNPSASSINGNLSANGYLVLQNPNGFTVGGSAAISAHGLVMTTASTPAFDLSSGGPWSFNTPPPTAKIINYGQINIAGGGSAFLIANDIQNNGTIAAPGGNIGLYAGQTVLVSTSPDGRGLSAKVTLPQGSVDNEGKLVADAGSIAAQAQVVNQNGVVQADSAQSVNGTIELVASGNLNLGASSAISANGDPAATTTPSPGGFVVLKSDSLFTVASGSKSSVSGTAGGQDGVVEIFAPGASASPIQPSGNYFALLLNPYDITLSSSTADTSTTDPTLNVGDLSAYSQIDLQALDSIGLSSTWSLPNSSSSATLSLAAGNNLILNPGAEILAGQGWSLKLTAGNIIANNVNLQADNITINSGTIKTAQGGNINFQANNQIELDSTWTLADSSAAVALSLTAGNSLTLGDGMTINAGHDWNLNLTADNLVANNASLQADNLAIASGVIQPTDGGNINLQAADDITLTSQGTPTPKSGMFGTVSLLAGNTITLDTGSEIEADGGKITLNAPTVYQNGTVQADSIGNAKGAVEIDASASLNLGVGSVISVNGDSTASTASSGGSVTIQSGNSFSDASGSAINVAGGTQGGNGGQVTISAPQMSAFQSSINGLAGAGYADASLSIDTADITLNADGSPVAGQLALNINSLSAGLSQINLQAANSIELSSPWNLTPKSGIIGALSLLAGNTITVDPGAGIEADAGRIAMSATTVNQNGVLRADSIGNANGAIEIYASGSSGSLNLGASSVISAAGDSTATSPGGFVVLNSAGTFSDLTGSKISVSGNNGGPNGFIEIFGNGTTANTVNSTIDGTAAAQFSRLFVNPFGLTLSSSATSTSSSSPNLNVSDLLPYSQICLYNIELSSQWAPDASTPGTLSLFAGNDITLDDGSGIQVGNNWTVNLTAGTLPSSSQPASGNDGIYLNGTAYIQAANGDANHNAINLYAANEVIVNGGAIRTIGGGNIDVTTEYGNVNTGNNTSGFNYRWNAPYYTPFQVSSSALETINYNQSNLGGISTAAGGNVTINAGGDVVSFPTTTVAANDPGTGAFGPEAGNVTINAGGSVYGNYVVMNGTGSINAGQNIGIGQSGDNQNVALSLAKGSWDLNAPNGNIYLQEVRNPNGVFNNTVNPYTYVATAGTHYFDYDSQASVTLMAGNGVYLTGYQIPRPNDAIPLIMPPMLNINAGPRGVVLQTPLAAESDVTLPDSDITLFASPDGNLQINDRGDFSSGNDDGSDASLTLSASSSAVNDNPVVINIGGNMENISLQVSKPAQISVAGDMIGCTFYGNNLNASDITSLTVGGQIYNPGSFNFITLDQGLSSLPVQDLAPGTANSWSQILLGAVNSAQLATLSPLSADPSDPSKWASYALNNAGMFPGIGSELTTELSYNSAAKTLTAIGPLSLDLLTDLEQPSLTVLRYGPNGYPLLDSSGHFVTDTVILTPSTDYAQLASLYQASHQGSQGAPPLGFVKGGYTVGGPGAFDINAGSISLGNSKGILSVGGATINVVTLDNDQTVNGIIVPSLNMPSSTIAALGGGDVNVTSDGENSQGISMDLGSQDLLPFEAQIMNASNLGLGIYTTGGGDVNVTALGTINIDSSRVATLNGGDVSITSLTGNVNAGSGGTVAIPVNFYSPAYSGSNPLEYVPANGIVADTLANASQIPGAAHLPGNITVTALQGNIIANLGGISQEAFGGTLSASGPDSPTITLTASGSSDLGEGNIILGASGVIGVNVNATASGTITGLIISQQNANINAAQSFAGTVLSGGTATLSAGGTISGTIIGIGGVNTGGGGVVTANVLSTSVNGGAGTLATSSSATAASQSAAGQTSAENQQQVASNSTGNDDERKKKKKAALVRSVGRVTVILPKAS